MENKKLNNNQDNGENPLKRPLTIVFVYQEPHFT